MEYQNYTNWAEYFIPSLSEEFPKVVINAQMYIQDEFSETPYKYESAKPSSSYRTFLGARTDYWTDTIYSKPTFICNALRFGIQFFDNVRSPRQGAPADVALPFPESKLETGQSGMADLRSLLCTFDLITHFFIIMHV